jgi:hypothetical protein
MRTATEQAFEAIQVHGPMTANEVYGKCDQFEDEAACSRVLAQMATREPVRLVRRLVDNPNSGQGARRQVYQYDTVERARGVAAVKINGEPANPSGDLLVDSVPAASVSVPAADTERERLRSDLHAARNDLAAYSLLVEAVMCRLGVDRPEAVMEALDARLVRDAQLGKPAVILIGDDDSADVLELPQDVDPRQRAMDLVRNGEVRQAVVARLMGRAVMPRPIVEWVAA